MNRLIINKARLKRRGLALALGALYYAVFLICYSVAIAPLYFYMGLTVRTLPDWCWVASFVMAMAPLLWMPLDLERPSDFAAWFLYLCLIFPACIVTFMVSNYPPEQMLLLPVTLLAAFVLFERIRRVKSVALPRIVGSDRIFSIILPAIMLVLSTVALALARFKFDLSVDDVYDRRLTARETVPGGSLMAYAVAFLRSVCIPIMTGIGIERRKWSYILIAAYAAIAIFSLDGTKSTLVLPLMLALVVYICMFRRVNAGFWFLGSLILIVSLCLVETAATGSSIIAAIFIRREMAVTGLVTTYYWEFFSHNPLVMLTDSLIGQLFPAIAPYGYTVSRLIGLTYFGSADINANANIWGAGFAHFGYVGVFMVSFVAGLIMRLLDTMGRQGRFTIAAAACAAIGMSWSNVALHTSILTHGVALLLIALFLYPSDKPIACRSGDLATGKKVEDD